MLNLLFMLSLLVQGSQIELEKIAEFTEIGDHFLSNIRSAEVLNDQLVIANGGAYQIIVADKDGNYLHSFGRSGSGPGEFQTLDMLAVSQNVNRLYTWDQGLARLSAFNEKGELLKSINVNGRFLGISADSEGGVFLSAIHLSGEGKLLTRVNIDEEEIVELLEPNEHTLNVHRSGNVGGITQSTGSDQIYYAHAFPYQITGVDRQGYSRFHFEHDHPDFKPPSEGQTVGNMVVGGELHTRISSITAVNDQIWVQYRTPDGNYADVISKENAEIIQTINLPDDHRLASSDGEYLFTFTVGRNAEPKVVKWRIVQ